MSKRKGLGDVIDIVKDYARQELLEPLRPIPRWIGFGLAGSVLLVLASIFLALSLLRFLQEETGTALTRNLSWLPHLITLSVALLALLLLFRLMRKRTL